MNGMGVAVISSSQGIITDKKARTDNLGGEVVCTIW
jgi:small subunit ribosomal protein S8